MCQEEAVFFQKNGLQQHYRIRHAEARFVPKIEEAAHVRMRKLHGTTCLRVDILIAMAQEDNKVEVEILCKWNGNFRSNQKVEYLQRSSICSGKFLLNVVLNTDPHYKRNLGLAKLQVISL